MTKENTTSKKCMMRKFNPNTCPLTKVPLNWCWENLTLLFNEALFWLKVRSNLHLLAFKPCNKPFNSASLSHRCSSGMNATHLCTHVAQLRYKFPTILRLSCHESQPETNRSIYAVHCICLCLDRRGYSSTL